jgi:MFS family permease
MSSRNQQTAPPDDPGKQSGENTAPTPAGPRGFLRTFSSFRNRNYRLFYFGQLFSVIGTWVQRIALAWLVLELTDSSFLLGAVTALQFTPIMLLSLFGGVIADRLPKRPIIIAMQTLMSIQALALGLLVLSDRIEVWHVFALSAVHGIGVAIENPTRQAFVAEMVGREQIANAVALNSSLFNSARMFGPALGGAMIAAFGTPPATASRHAVIFGIMPDSSDGRSASRSGTEISETSESRLGQSR